MRTARIVPVLCTAIVMLAGMLASVAQAFDSAAPHLSQTEVDTLVTQVDQMGSVDSVEAVSGGEAKAWRRSWMLGYCSAVVARVRAAEEAAVAAASAGESAAACGQSAALVLADRSLTVRRQVETAYPHIRRTKVTYTGRGYADGYGVRIRLDAASAAGDVRGDPDWLLQVVTNLLSNAVKFSPPAEEVVVAIENRSGTIQAEVGLEQVRFLL